MTTKFYFITLMLYLLLVTACSPTPNSIVASLAQAGKCMESYPDSALNILKSIPEPERLHGKAQADYCLLMTQAMHKNDIKFTSDSLINIAVGYYGSHATDVVSEGKAFFYCGKVMQAMDSTELAMKCYLKAKDVLNETKEYKMLGLIAEGMGELNRMQKLLDVSLDNYRLSLRYYSMIPDSLSISFANRNIGRSFVLMKQIDSAFHYYNRALFIASSKKYFSESSVLREIGGLYRSMNNYKQAEYYFLASIEKAQYDEDLYRTYLSLGYLYGQYNELDKAENALKVCLKWKNIALQKDTYECLYHIERKQNNLAQAVLYKDKADSLLDLTHNSETQEMIAKLQKKYDNERLQKENLQMSIKNKNTQLIAAILVFVAALVIIYFYNKNRANKRQIRYVQQQLKDKEVALALVECDLEEFKEKEEKTEDYKTRIGELNGKLILLKQQKGALAEQLDKLGGTALKVDTIVEEYLAGFRILLSLKQMNVKEDKNIDINWKRLYDLCDLLSLNFMAKLVEEYPNLTKHSKEICCLLRLRFTNEELSRIFHTTLDSVTKAKGRVKKGLNLSTDQDLDEFIRNF
ncbi:tetratricopeptide repeat protein [Bacteroides sp.]